MAGMGYRVGRLLGRQSLGTKLIVLVVLLGLGFLAARNWQAIKPFASFLVGLVVLLILISAALGAGAARLKGDPTGDPMACTSCGHVGPTKPHTRGQFWVEVVLWLLLLVPGIIYTVWRLSTRTLACAVCGGTRVVPVDSPVGRRIAAESGDMKR